MPNILPAIVFLLFTHAVMAAEPGYIYAGLGENNSAEKPAGKQYFPCGPTGIRAEITVERSTEFLVRYVFDDCPATGKVLPGDRIIGANGKVWKQKDLVRRTPGAFEEGGYDGPRFQLGMAVEESEGGDGKLSLIIIREDKRGTVDVRLKPIGKFSKTFPYNCKKTEIIVKQAAKFLDDKKFIFSKAGYWYRRYMPAVGLIAQGDPEGTVKNYYVPLLAEKYKKDYSDDPVPGKPREWSWDMAMEGITLAECYLYTGEKRLLPRMEWLNRWYATGAVANGGFCHKHGQSGYGTMTAPTAMVCAAWALFKRCGVEIDEKAYMRSRWILDACTLPNGDFPYSTQSCPNPEKGTWEPGKGGRGRRFAGTAYAAVYHFLDPCERYSGKYVHRVVDSVAESKAIFPDGHASGIMHVWGGFLAARLAAEVGEDRTYREVLDYYKYWLNVNRNPDGSFTLPPSRDRVTSADPGMDTRYNTTGAVLLFLSGPKRNLEMLGRSRERVASLLALDKGRTLFEEGKYAEAYEALIGLARAEKTTETSRSAVRILQEIAELGAEQLAEIKTQAATDPKAAMAALEKMQAEFKGFRIATAAASLHAELSTQSPVRVGSKTVGAPPGDKQSSPKAEKWLELADSFMRSGKTTSAKRYLRMILDEYPDSKEAEKATRLLEGK